MACDFGQDFFGAVVGGAGRWLTRQAGEFQRLGRAVPGAEILGGEVLVLGYTRAAWAWRSNLAQVAVHIAGTHGVHRAVGVLVLEQVLPRQLLATPHHTGHTRVAEGDLLLHTTLAAKTQLQCVATHTGMACA